MVSPLAPRSLKLVRETWTKTFAEIRKLGQPVVIRPQDSNEIFRIEGADGDRARLETTPVVFHIPERVIGKKGNRLFVVVKGEIEFALEGDGEDIRASGFATRVAYFRVCGAGVKHIFGMHFDLDRTVGHPVFHAQLRPYGELYQCVLEMFPSDEWDVAPIDCVNGLLRNVRLPTAQMDFFSVILLICSDHLVSASAKPVDRDIRAAYEKIRRYCGAFLGYGEEHQGLRDMAERRCARSHFWYADPS